MRASGRLSRVRSSWMNLNFEDPCPKDGTLPVFGMENVILPFAILGGGLAFAIILLLVEFVIKKWFGRLLAQGKEESALQELARKNGIRLTSHWQMVQLNITNIAEPTEQR